jgi:hypothetical protein
VKRRTAYLVAGATLVAAAAVLSGIRVLMVAGGLPLGLVLPGLALSALLFRRPDRLVTIERIMLVPALSLGTLILGGLFAWAVRAPLHRVTWLALSAGVTLAALAAVVLRTPAVPASAAAGVRGSRSRPHTTADSALVQPVHLDGEGLFEPGHLDREGRFEPEPTTRRRRLLKHVLPACLAVAMLAGATWLSLATSISSHEVTVTTLSVVPPGAVDSSGDRSIQVNATGLSPRSAYALQVTSTSENTRTTVTADENGLWTSTLRLPGDERLTLALYRAGSTTALRTVIVASAATG